MKEDNVAVLTLINSINYGGTLQAIALNQVLKKLGKNVIYIKYGKDWKILLNPFSVYKRLLFYYDENNLINRLKAFLKALLSMKDSFSYTSKKKRYKKYKEYINNYIKLSQEFLNINDLKNYDFDCGVFIVGSDQVWNADIKFQSCLDPVYLLEFVPAGTKKIAYAASAGGKKSEEEIEYLYEYLRDFTAISVREDSLALSLNHFGLNCVSVLDPTLLLNAYDWNKYEESFQMKYKFILVYSLEYDEHIEQQINLLLKKGLKILDVSPEKFYKKTKCEYKNLNTPGEFLYAIHNSSGILTNSFHGTVFSIIYRRHFITTTRKGQESRTYDLLSKLNLLDHLDVDIENTSFMMSKEINYNAVEKILEDQQSKSLEFLKRNIQL